MSVKEVDVAILGAGTAGITARRAAMKAGARVVMIDPGPFGTTCARVGCMPSKLLIAAADAAHHARQADRFGVRAGGVEIDGPAVMQRVQSERDRFVGFVTRAIDEARADGQVLVGRGTITAPGTLEVDDGTTVRFRGLVIATGTAPFVPPPFRGVEAHLLTNETVFDEPDVPESLLVVGAGIIGLELGQAFHRLGARVTIVDLADTIGPISDPVIAAEARRVLCEELDLHPTYDLHSIEAVDSGVRARFTDSTGAERDERYAKVLVAAGRRAHLDALGLESFGIEKGEDGRYPIDRETLQVADRPVFVAGDANSLHPLLHEAADDGRLAGHNAARFPEVRAPRRREPLAIAFTDPQIGIVGGGYRTLGECAAVAGEVDYGDQGRARVQGIDQGKVRIYAERRTGRLIGAELFGPRVEHLSHLLAWSVQRGLTVQDALDMPFYHPVVEEGIRTALRDVAVNLSQDEPIRCRVSEMGVGS